MSDSQTPTNQSSDSAPPVVVSRKGIVRGVVTESEKRLFLRFNYYIITIFQIMNVTLGKREARVRMIVESHYHDSISHTSCPAASLLFFRLCASLHDVSLAVIAIFTGMLVIDGYSYMGHHVIDNYGTEKTPRFVLPSHLRSPHIFFFGA